MGGGDQCQQQAGGRYPIAYPAAGFFPQAFREPLPAYFLVIKALVGEGVRCCESPPPG
jgi:hypothetical protein